MSGMLGDMTLNWKIVIDCADPHAQAAFWAAELGYVVEDNRVLIERLRSAGAIPQDTVVTVDDRPAFRTLHAVRHPDDPVQESTGIGLGKRLLFQQVPEPKTVKNRLHLDLHAGPDRRDGEVARLRELGATVLQEINEPGTEHVVMADLEGNEFCVQQRRGGQCGNDHQPDTSSRHAQPQSRTKPSWPTRSQRADRPNLRCPSHAQHRAAADT